MDTLTLGQTDGGGTQSVLQTCESSTSYSESSGYTASCSSSSTTSSSSSLCSKRKKIAPSTRKRGRKLPPVSSSDEQLDCISASQASLKYNVEALPVSTGQENVHPNIVVANKDFSSLSSDQSFQIQELQKQLDKQIAISNQLAIENQQLKQRLGSQKSVVQSNQGIYRRSSLVPLSQLPSPGVKPTRKLLPKTPVVGEALPICQQRAPQHSLSVIPGLDHTVI